jgi:ERCC4-type nuclease
MRLRSTATMNAFVGRPLRSVAVPDGFVLIQDTREQQPLFNRTEATELPEDMVVVPGALNHGDYSVKGFEDRICFERKRLSDLYSYIGKERQRTLAKMQQFLKMVLDGGFVGLVVEAEEASVLTGYAMSRVSPEAARQALVSFEVRYGIHVYYSRCRDNIRRWILDRAVKFYNIQREVNSPKRIEVAKS